MSDKKKNFLKECAKQFKSLIYRFKTVEKIFDQNSDECQILNEELKKHRVQRFDEILHPFEDVYTDKEKILLLPEHIPNSFTTETECIELIQIFLARLPILLKMCEILKQATDQQSEIINKQRQLLARMETPQRLPAEPRYCPDVITWIKCGDKLSPIYQQQYYTADERNKIIQGKNTSLRIFQSFCAKNTEFLVNFISANGTECGLEKRLDIKACFNPRSPPYVELGVYRVIVKPMVDNLCNFLDVVIDCIVPAFEECTLSQTPVLLLKSFFTHIKSETLCSNRRSDNSTVNP